MLTHSSALVLTIGRNVGSTPMPDATWRRFRADVRAALADAGATVHLDGATGRGTWVADDGTVVRETSATWSATVPTSALAAVRTAAAVLAARYSQDAVAVTVGTTDLVVAA